MFNFNLLIGICFALVAIQTSAGKKRQCLGPNCVQGLKKVPIRNSSSQLSFTKVCPDDKSVCEDDETCCALNIGGYGCCDPDHSRCCGDGVHCCPNEIPKVNQIKLKRVPVETKVNNTVRDVVCPGESFVCPPENTCCNISGEWACCNLSNAVCCSDGIHCCPSGFTCHMEIGKCVKETRKQRKNNPILP